MIAEIQPSAYDASPEVRVLILGGGYSGLLLAKELLILGLSVIVAEKENLPESSPGRPAASPAALEALVNEMVNHPQVEILTHTSVIQLEGEIGAFEAELVRDGKEEIKRNVAAVAVAPEMRTRSLFEAWRVQPSPQVISIKDFEPGDEAGKQSAAVKNALFLDQPKGEGSPWQTRRLVDRALELQKQRDCQCYVVISQMKVAEEGLERLYREAREAGVIFIRVDQAELKQGPGGTTLFYYDPLLDRRFYLTPDLIVVGEEDIPPEGLEQWAEALGIAMDPNGWMQEDNVLRSPAATNRLGVWVVGSAAGPVSPRSMGTIVLAAVEEIFSHLKGGPIFPLFPSVELTRARCARCLTCLRLCPHGAVSWANKPVFSPKACQGCGICASECPREVLKLVGYGDQEIRERLASPWKPDGTPRIVLLCCEKSGLAAVESLSEARKRTLNVKVVQFPCAGRIKMTFILDSFYLGSGADGVMVVGCHVDNCKSGTGTIYARNRVAAVKEIMAEMDLEPQRVELISLASNMGARLYKEVVQFKERLARLEPFISTAEENGDIRKAG